MEKSDVMPEERTLGKVLEEKALEAGEPTELGQNEAKAPVGAGCLHFICSRE